METYGIKKYGKCPSARQMEWYRRERTIFFHFGMNTFSDREWGDGTENPKDFNPTALDCRQWIRTIKAAGFTMAILTAKHHDGFCLWPSRFTEHSIKNSPYKDGKGDIVREFTDACHEYGIKAGIYLSPWDRHEPSWGTEAYNDFYANQLTELMTGYGKLWECWWDGAGSEKAHYDWGRWAYIVRDKQPDAVIFGALGATPYVEVRWVGNESGVAGSPCFATINAHDLYVQNCDALNSGTADGELFVPAEADVSIRPGWFYHAEQDAEVRTPKNLLKLWFDSVGKNAGLLLNLPPDRRGLVHERDAQNLCAFHQYLANATAVNLAQSATVTASGVYNENCKPENLLTQSEEAFYAPKDNTAAVEFAFDTPVTFNACMVSELIELGHKIRGFRVDAEVGGIWKTLFTASCMGYRQAEYFYTVTTQRVRLVITEAVDTPAIRSFALYRFDETLFDEEDRKLSGRNLMESAAARIEKSGNEYVVDLGGIFPYNTVDFCGEAEGVYQLYVFNGTTYALAAEGTVNNGYTVCTIETVTDSYKFKLKTTVGIENIAVFCK